MSPETALEEALGNGQESNLQIVSGLAKEQYLDAFSASLDALIDAVPNLPFVHERENHLDYGRILQETAGDYKNVLYLLTYRRDVSDKRGIEELTSINPDGEKDGIGIDPSASGFANPEWMRILYVMKKDLPNLRSGMPSQRRIVNGIVNRLFEGEDVSDLQESYIRHKYIDELERRTIPVRMGGRRIAVKEHANGSARVSSVVHKFSTAQNMPMIYTMTYDVGKKLWKDIKDGQKEVDYFLTHCTEFSTKQQHAYMAQLYFMDFDPKLKPLIVDRFRIGPFQFSETENNEAIEKIFETADNPYALHFRYEQTHLEKTLTKANLVSDQTQKNFIICPVGIKNPMEELSRLYKDATGMEFDVIGVAYGEE